MSRTPNTNTTINHDALVNTPIVSLHIPPPLAYGGLIVRQHPHLHDDGGDWHEVLGKGIKRASGTTTYVVFPLAQYAPIIINKV